MALLRFTNFRARCLLTFIGVALVLWIMTAYLVLPHWWRYREHQHPALAEAPTLTSTLAGLQGDPLNLFIVATEHELAEALFS